MADPEVDHGFVLDSRGDIDVVRSPFFDVGFGFDNTVEYYLNRIIPPSRENPRRATSGRKWIINGHPPASPTPASSPATSPLGITCVIVVSLKFERFYDFINAVNTIASLQHPQLCKLLGFHAREGSDQRMLVYERLYHGSLDRLLYGRSDGPTIDWPGRIKLAIYVARGHFYCTRGFYSSFVLVQLRSFDDVTFACPIESCTIFIGSKDGSWQVRIVVVVMLHCFAGDVRLHERFLGLLCSCSTSLLRRVTLAFPIGSCDISIGNKDGSSEFLKVLSSTSVPQSENFVFSKALKFLRIMVLLRKSTILSKFCFVVEKHRVGDMSLPPGFRFHPTDVELVEYFLKRKVEG
ncbi:PTI1-like tyrosine-protein kinase 2 [Dendrobium catenatum]|uniref:PTI1-like tyrosine-protein kinase 2 n=1 Tax=Dendrobium catenatum TaxID=906689 RepID=A0A2I0WKN3_9ASPA|nr:PTI1-like tyrosine-protein kinase 2 [Dendrobium catenatum]